MGRKKLVEQKFIDGIMWQVLDSVFYYYGDSMFFLYKLLREGLLPWDGHEGGVMENRWLGKCREGRGGDEKKKWVV